ncbi:protein bicaudal D homolog 2-like [Carcharodon carcharias]|uniref:protein bicaudal D homolog 2-like n=1 Tax=Carcharodon carcharias TaxID=13397 RepID=UPI001B7E661E|nr:protein bicaudal D homolog 2-like [Carcharodon carcharias]
MMADPAGVSGQEELESLRAEVERLSAELAETSQQKVQAAQYGLAVLEEKQGLKQRFAELEQEHEAAVQELERLKEAFADACSNQKKAAADGETREETMLREAARKEGALATRITELQAESKQTKTVLTNTVSENERLNGELQEVKKLCESLELEKCQLRDEIKESKVRESQQLQDCTELEEENIALQKLVSMLRENQVEFEGLKHEMKQREEDIEILHSQLEEATRLRGIVERQLEEALETVRTEREQKNALRKELSANASGSFCNLPDGLEELRFDDSAGQDELDSGYHQGSSHLNGEVRVSTPRAGQAFRPAPGLVSDLFSELSLSEMQKLKQQLVQAEREKATLLTSVQELQKRLEASCRGGGPLSEAAPHPGEGEEAGGLEAEYQEALAEVARLKAELQELQGKYLECEGRHREEQEHWRLESRELAENIELHVKCNREDQECIARLQKEVRAVAKVAVDSQGGLGRAQEELAALSEELAGLYHHVCLCNNVTPNRVTLDYYKGSRSRAGPPLRRRRSSDLFGRVPAEPHDGGGSGSSGGDLSPRSLPSSPVPEAADAQREPLNVLNLSAVIRSQIKHLQAVVELSRQRAALQLLAPGTDKDKEALIEEVLKLKSLLSTKREQIATLRTVLKANKQTAEVALSNLKSKYDNEKCLVSDTMVKLRNELKALKEDAATFSSLRSMFASRCDQYVTQLDEMQRQLAAAEDEKKTLNSLLRMAIQQKLALTQRLEDQDSKPEHPRHGHGRSKPHSKSKPRAVRASQQQQQQNI